MKAGEKLTDNKIKILQGCVWGKVDQSLQAKESLVSSILQGIKVCVCVCVCVYGRIVFWGGCGLGKTVGVRVRLITKGLEY